MLIVYSPQDPCQYGSLEIYNKYFHSIKPGFVSPLQQTTPDIPPCEKVDPGECFTLAFLPELSLLDITYQKIFLRRVCSADRFAGISHASCQWLNRSLSLNGKMTRVRIQVLGAVKRIAGSGWYNTYLPYQRLYIFIFVSRNFDIWCDTFKILSYFSTH